MHPPASSACSWKISNLENDSFDSFTIHDLSPTTSIRFKWINMTALRRKAPDFQVEERNAGEQCERAAAAEKLPTNSIDLGSEIWKVAKSNVIGVSIEGYYFPDDEYDSLLKEVTIQDALGGGHEVLPLVKYVLDHTKKTFATLLQVFTDSKSRREVMDSLMASEFKDTLLGSHKLDPSYFKHKLWNESTIDTFKDKRLSFIVPTFDSETFMYEFDKNQPLPFTASGRADTPPRSGHFSQVECVEMSASKHNMADVKSKTFKVALKKLIRLGDPGYGIEKEWEREARAHQQLNQKSDNIIQAFAAFHQIAMNNKWNDEYYLVLEWADGGSLFDFWKSHPEPQVEHLDHSQVRRRIKGMLEQLYGLAQALEAMHSTRSHSPRHSRSDSASSPALRPQMSADWKESSLGAGVLPADSSSLPTFNFDSADDDDSKLTVPSIVVSSDPVSLKVTESPDSQNWRHGDIKPENKLRFIVDEDYDKLGVLKLADLGRTQQHQFVTRMRHTTERELWRTRWYEPPDLDGKNQEKAGGKISRLYDIWSMGAVIFEAVLWLLYGYESHNDFWKENGFLTGETHVTPYWRKEGEGKYRVTDVVNKWMDDILEPNSEPKDAISGLIKLVSERLLKIDLPPNSDLYTKGFRTNAKDLREQLAIILERANGDERYLFSGKNRRRMSQPDVADSATKSSSQSTGNSSSSPNDTRIVSIPAAKGRGTGIAQRHEYTNSIKNEWVAYPENSSFVESILEDRDYSIGEAVLCTDCKLINISSQHTEIAYHIGKLEAKSRRWDCDLCELVYTVAKEQNLTSRSDTQEILLKQSGKDFVLKETNQKFLRLINIEQDTLTPEAAPELPLLANDHDPSSKNLESFIKVLKAWLKECDSNHGCVCAPKDTHLVPKRLINVEIPTMPKIVTADLYKNIPSGGIRYLALSHKWGDMPAEAKTTMKNIEERKDMIPLDELPLSFKNAIVITKALKCSYLWIDSLCIIQGLDGEFSQEADKMQTTFDGAYCVLAACSAQSAKDGFLHSRGSRPKYLKTNNVYVSPVTNDFESDVLRSPLSCRGWVLQERALARRTIYFTDTQTYWECGKGIRCETLATLRNDKIAFLGDPNFPDYTIRPTSTVGEQIDLFINLFQTYTRLEFSHPQDRPVAINGLMERLTVAFKTRSLAGLFETFWGRCLLWRRADNVELLRKIPHGTHSRRVPPTWSWMAFDGAISFIEPLGGQVDWNNSGVTLQFANLNCDQTSWLKTSRHSDSLAIQAKAFDFNIPAGAGESEASIFYDGEKITPTKCVIIGTDKQNLNDASTKKHYVLIVKPVSKASNGMSYERVGVGYMLGKFIHLDKSYVTVTIE